VFVCATSSLLFLGLSETGRVNGMTEALSFSFLWITSTINKRAVSPSHAALLGLGGCCLSLISCLEKLSD
jgi:hypothetical protein